MDDLILHHYPASPFSEKVRAILGYKQLAWKSVHMPPVMPKPDLIALTGGYRRAPVLQVGADVYCDSKLIVRVLDRVKPNPPLVPDGAQATCAMYEQWTEQVLFFLVIPVVFQPQGLAHVFGQMPPGAMPQFQKDREALFAGGHARKPSPAATAAELPAFLARLDQQLEGAPFVLGNAPALADFSILHILWFIGSNPGVAAYLAPYPSIGAWMARLAALGHGEPQKISGEDAIAVARGATPRTVEPGAPAPGPKPGDRVTVSAVDYGTDPIAGELVRINADEVAIRRRDERAGEVVVHFPRAGFKVTADKS